MKPAKLISFLFLLFLLAGCNGTTGGTPDNSNGKQASNSGTHTSMAGTTGVGTAGPTSTTSASSGLSTLTIQASNGKKVRLNVEIADAEAEREKGLMNRTAMGEDHGMIFIFPGEQTLSFWMKDTLIPLSVAFMDSNGRIIDIQDMQPQDLTSHLSAKPAQYALEVNQGFFEKHGVKVGDSVDLPR